MKSDIKNDKESKSIDFGGWESQESKLRHNLTLTPEQILTWLEQANKFIGELKGENVLR